LTFYNGAFAQYGKKITPPQRKKYFELQCDDPKKLLKNKLPNTPYLPNLQITNKTPYYSKKFQNITLITPIT